MNSYFSLNKPILTQEILARTTIFFLIVSAVLIPFYLNRYPILFNDTGTYLRAFNGLASFQHPPLDRPVFYSVFIYLTSLGRRSIYLVPAVQALIEAEILCVIICKYENDLVRVAITVVALALSFLAVMTSCIEPDAWLIIAFSAVISMGFRPARACYSFFIVFIATLFAPANGAIIAAASFISIAILLLVRPIKARQLMIPFIVAFMAGSAGYVTLSVENYAAYGIPSPIAGSSLFLFARFNASKIGGSVLAETCAKPTYSLRPPCVTRDRYKDLGVNNFLWHNKSLNIWTTGNIQFFNKVDRGIEATFPKAIFAMDIRDAIKLSLRVPDNIGQFYGQHTKPALKAIRSFHLNYVAARSSWQHHSFRSFPYLRVVPILEGLFIVYAAISFWNSDRERVANALAFINVLFTLATFVLNSMVDGLSQLAFRYNAKGISVFLILGIAFLALSKRSTPSALLIKCGGN